MVSRLCERLGMLLGGKIGATLRRNYGVDREYYTLFHDMLGFTPFNIELYKLALIHRSASFHIDSDEADLSSITLNNERLEYLGDAIIEAVTSDFLYIEFPYADEGFMTKMRSKIVSRNSLNRIALSLGLNALIVTNKSLHGVKLGENGRQNNSQMNLMGDAFEALIGAIYLDMGYEFTNRLLINSIFAEHLDMDRLQVEETDFKSRLIEWAQKEHLKIEFVTTSDTNDHNKPPLFSSTIFIGGVEVGHGFGGSKKEAEQSAALSIAQGGLSLSDDHTDRLLNKIDQIDSERIGVDEN
ncbi:MAG: ribonuclease III [Rikenellaceae bacterium]